MKKNLKLSLAIGVGTALGTLIYQIIMHGVSEIDWQKAVFIGFFTFSVFLIFCIFKEKKKE